jgi:transcriptional regulator with XRE-family HTH domain
MEFAERFSDLRHSDNRGGERVKSYQQISKEIEAKTGVYISHAQLSKYRRMEDGETRLIYPKVTQVLAIADYYGVSVEYLLGLSDSKSNEDKYKVGSKAFGLSDSAMKALEIFTGGRNIPFPEEYNYDMTDYMNYLITDIGPELLTGIISFFKVLDEMEAITKDPELHSARNQELTDLNETSLAKKYALVQVFEKLLNRLRQEIDKSSQKKRKAKTQPSPYFLHHPFFRAYMRDTDNAKPPR